MRVGGLLQFNAREYRAASLIIHQAASVLCVRLTRWK